MSGGAAPSSADADGLWHAGLLLWKDGKRDDAVAMLTRAATLAPDRAELRNHLGNALLECGRGVDALAHLQAAAELWPDSASFLYNLGNALAAAGRPQDAETQFRAALRRDPEHPGAHNNLGNVLRALGRHDEAAACYRCAIAVQPDLAGTHNNLGSALLALHRPAEAEVALREALRLRPDYAEACNNLGGALLALDRPEEACPQFRRAVALDPAQVQARFGEALALLALGRYREGWAAYESRWRDPRFCEDERSYDMPLWDHAPSPSIAGRTLLLHAEQGLGDTIQFVRYVPMVCRLGARVVLEVQQPLVRLLAGMADAVIPAGADLPPCDAHCPLLSLPHAFGTELPTVPATIPYLHADDALKATWRTMLGPAAGLRVGLAISGSPEHPEDALRSIPAALLRPLLMLPGVEFHLVQKDVREADAATLGAVPGLKNHSDQLDDFADTAALLSTLDLLVSVDTSVAHLGGALGLPVWLLVQWNADFRWLRLRSDSPWYPTMRLFRQNQPQRWEPVVARVADALRDRATRRDESVRP